MLKRFTAMVCVFSFAGLLALGCDSGGSKASGTGGTIGGGTGGSSGTGGAAGGSSGTGGAGGAGGAALTPAQQNAAIINAPAPSNVIARDPSIAGTPPPFMNGVCQ